MGATTGPICRGFGDSSHPHGVLDVAALADALAAWIEAPGLRPTALPRSSG